VLKLSHNYIIMIYTFRRMCIKHYYTLNKAEKTNHSRKLINNKFIYQYRICSK